MKKIMFNDRYGLTGSVMSGLKTMTRRIEEDIEFFYCVNNMKGVRIVFDGKDTFNAYTSKGELYAAHKCRYALGEEVSVAQSYMDAGFKEDDVNVPGGIRYGQARGWKNKMYVKASAIPNAMFQPIPPLRFFEESDTPIIVRMNAENGRANRVCFSMSANFTLASPRIF